MPEEPTAKPESKISAIEGYNTNLKYWKISPGENAEYWNEFKDNKWISLGWYNDKDWRKTKFGDLTKNPDKEKIIKILREEDPLNFLFCWSSVPGNDNLKFLSFIKKWLFEQLWEDTSYDDYTTEVAIEHLKKCNIAIDLKKFSDKKGNDYADSILAYVRLMNIDFDDNLKIKKNNDRTINFSYLDNSGEITLDENRKNAMIKINNQYSDKLHVKYENSKLNIYKYTDKQISSWADIIIRFFEIKPGHKVMVYGKSFHINALAEVIGEYEFKDKFNFPHIKSVKWLQIFKKPLDIKPILNKLEKQAFRPTVVDISKKDWDTIFNYAKQVGGIEEKSEEKTTSDEILKNLFNQARIELGSNKILNLDDVLSKMKQVAEAKGQYLSNNWEIGAKEKIKNEWATEMKGLFLTMGNKNDRK